MKAPHPIPYQGSKRNLSDQILYWFPSGIDRLIEPFAGSAAITISAAMHRKCSTFQINDINSPLIGLWDLIINHPSMVAKDYASLWQAQVGNEERHYYQIRDEFNRTQQPSLLLFLLAKCVKAAVRYNAAGEFNQSPDKRRLGKHPETMAEDIHHVSRLLKGKTHVSSLDYRSVLLNATSDDLVYMDPPYQGTGLNGGFNYAGNILQEDFIAALDGLNDRSVPYIVSYDGKTGDKEHGVPLPAFLGLKRMGIVAGRSSQATLLNRSEMTVESLYLSPALLERLNSKEEIRAKQVALSLFSLYEISKG